VPSVALLTLHVWPSPRRAGFHHLAAAYARLGWDVLFMTVAISPLSRLRKDHRLAHLAEHPPNQLHRVPLPPAPGAPPTDPPSDPPPSLTAFVWRTPFHAANLRLGPLNALAGPLWRRYHRLPLGPVEPLLEKADLLILESTPGLLLHPRLQTLNPTARRVYRVSDDLSMLCNHPDVIAAEDCVAQQADLVSVPSRTLRDRFAHRPGVHVQLQPHGLATDLFDQSHDNPYLNADLQRFEKHAVWVGNCMFDRDALAAAADAAPSCAFHVIGPPDALGPLPDRPNILGRGEMPFPDTVPYLQHADLGLANRTTPPGAESLSDSLKITQYRYCRLPILLPRQLLPPAGDDTPPPPGCFPYTPGHPTTIAAAIRAALTAPRPPRPPIRSWTQLADDLAGPLSAPAT
jgi:2-beta-glucuronyltransferase